MSATGSGKNGEKSKKTVIVGILFVTALAVIGMLLVNLPTSQVLGEGIYCLRSAFHGLFAGIFMVTMTIGLYQAFRLWMGGRINLRELEIGSLINAAACFVAVFSGNWLYIHYRAPGGPRSYFLEKAPEIHKIFFEFKEFAALFTLPLAVCAVYLAFRYGERLNSNHRVREMIALVLALAFFYFLIAFGLGAAVTKLKPV